MPIDKKKDLDAGLNLGLNKGGSHPSGPPRHGELGQAERAFTLASTFLSGVLAITASQFIGAPLKLIDPAFYDAYMAYTKESFAVLITSLTQWWAPTVVRVSGDESMKGQLIKLKDGSLQCNFSSRLVLMANHQLYTDWLYLWWIAYTNKMHGRVYIILKESLKKIPIIGWGCQFYNFIFLSRKWEQDQARFRDALAYHKDPTNPMWLLIFPEGTNLSAGTKEKSKQWAQKNGLQDMKHQLLPRSTGLRFCLQELADTTDWLYDCTIAYEGVPAGQFGQDVFTLRSSFFEGRPPKSVNMHWRRFHISDIPYQNTKAFDVWLRNRWREKDYLLEYFSKHTRFPATSYWKEQLADSQSESSMSLRSVPRAAFTIETEVKSGKFEEFLRIFAPITALAMALFLAYGASPEDLPFPNGGEFFQQFLGPLMGNLSMPNNVCDIEKMIEGGPTMPTTMPDVKMGNTPADKAKQQKYLQLFKESLPKDISLEAEQRRRVASFVKNLPDTPAARKAAVDGAKAGVKRNQQSRPTKAASTLAQARRPPGSAAPVARTAPKAQSVKTTPASRKVPTASVPVSKPPGAVVAAPRFAEINGVRVQIQPSSKPEAPSIPAAKLVRTKDGFRLQQSEAATKVESAGPTPISEFIQTKDGRKIKRPGTSQPVGSVKYPPAASGTTTPAAKKAAAVPTKSANSNTTAIANGQKKNVQPKITPSKLAPQSTAGPPKLNAKPEAAKK